MNTSETLPDGVWFRDNPSVSGPRLNGYGVYRGDQVELKCYGWGESLGPYANRLWYYSANLTRPSAPGRANVGWLNAHYIDDKQKSNIPTPGVAPCDTGGGPSAPTGGGSTSPTPGAPDSGSGSTRPAVLGCYDGLYWGKRTLTWSYSGGHRYLGNAYQAAANWNNVGANLNLVYVPMTARPDIVFNDYNRDDGLYGYTPNVWNGRSTTSPPSPPMRLWTSQVNINLNQKMLDWWLTGRNAQQLDFMRTYTATHELGHALGLAHPEECSKNPTSIMSKGRTFYFWNLPKFNGPQDFDRKELKGIFP